VFLKVPSSLRGKKTQKEAVVGTWMCMNTCNDVHSLDNLVKIAFTEPVRTQGTSKLLAGVNGPCLKSNAFII
jgi:hypothetical protein